MKGKMPNMAEIMQLCDLSNSIINSKKYRSDLAKLVNTITEIEQIPPDVNRENTKSPSKTEGKHSKHSMNNKAREKSASASSEPNLFLTQPLLEDNWSDAVRDGLVHLAMDLKRSNKRHSAHEMHRQKTDEKHSQIQKNDQQFAKKQQKLEKLKKRQLAELSQKKVQSMAQHTNSSLQQFEGKQQDRTKEVEKTLQRTESAAKQQQSRNQALSESLSKRHEEINKKLELYNAINESRRNKKIADISHSLHAHSIRHEEYVEHGLQERLYKNEHRARRHQQRKETLELEEQEKIERITQKIMEGTKKVHNIKKQKEKQLFEKTDKGRKALFEEIKRDTINWIADKTKEFPRTPGLPSISGPDDPNKLTRFKKCALCEHVFRADTVIQQTTVKRIKEQREKWGFTNSINARKPGTLYDKVKICTFCFQLMLPAVLDGSPSRTSSPSPMSRSPVSPLATSPSPERPNTVAVAGKVSSIPNLRRTSTAVQRSKSSLN